MSIKKNQLKQSLCRDEGNILPNGEVQRRFPSIRSPWWRVGGSWLGWRGIVAVSDYTII